MPIKDRRTKHAVTVGELLEISKGKIRRAREALEGFEQEHGDGFTPAQRLRADRMRRQIADMEEDLQEAARAAERQANQDTTPDSTESA